MKDIYDRIQIGDIIINHSKRRTNNRYQVKEKHNTGCFITLNIKTEERYIVCDIIEKGKGIGTFSESYLIENFTIENYLKDEDITALDE